MDAEPGKPYSPARAWATALNNIAPLPDKPWLNLPLLIDILADKHGHHTALESREETLSYRTLSERKSQYARWALKQRVGPGSTVALLMPNCPTYLAIWLGISQVGACVALINTNLTGRVLQQVLTCASPGHLIIDKSLMEPLKAIRAELPSGLNIWSVGDTDGDESWLHALDPSTFEPGVLAASCHAPVVANMTALLIYTSGTTGLPKAAKINHYRILEWSYWFAGMMDTGPGDRLYNCLPMYHSTGGVAGIGAILVNGGTVVIRKRFSASRFWDDVVANACTVFMYIGELCRYLLDTDRHPRETHHTLRLCCGNGLQADVWDRFTQRFQIDRVLEFYASTEGNVSLYNCEGKAGALGRIPSFLAHRFPVALIQCDATTGTLLRNANGHCIRCQPGEVGEAIGKISGDGGLGPAAFEGYTDVAATDSKILRNVFEQGDSWFRTGDLMRRDQAGFWYFVDRMGDSFRWKGENVSTTQVSDIVGSCEGVTGAAVYGVAVVGHEGRAGMAAITIGPSFSLSGLYAALREKLPSYARPVFIRVCQELETTATFKVSKVNLMREGADAAATTDPIYVVDDEARTYRQLPGRSISHSAASVDRQCDAGHVTSLVTQ